MKVYIVKVEYGFFHNKFSEFKIIENWTANFLPSKDDIMVFDDKKYRVLQRQFYSKDIVKIYIG